MALGDIYRDLQAAAQAGELRGDAPKGLADLLASLNVAALPVAGGMAVLGSDSAWLTGTTQLLNSDWSLKLTGREGGNPNDPDRAALVLMLAAEEETSWWTLGQAFGATLPPSRRVATGESGGLVLGPSVLAPLVLEQPRMTAANDPAGGYHSPRLAGSLPLEGRPDAPGSDLLSAYATYLGTTLSVDGNVDFSDPVGPKLDLPAVSSAQIGLASLNASAVGIRLTTEYPDPSFMPTLGARRSAALLIASVSLPTTPARVAELTGPLLIGDNVWPLQIGFDTTPLTLDGGIQALLAIAGVSDASAFALPTGVAPLNEFRLSDVGFGVEPPEGGLPRLAYASVGIASMRPWDPPVPFLLIREVGTRWAFAFDPAGRTLVTGSIYGTMAFGEKRAASLGAAPPFLVQAERDPELHASPLTPPVTVTIRLDLPDMAFTAFTEEPFDVPISDAFKAFFGDDVPNDLGLTAGLTVENLNMYASLSRKEFGAGMTVGGNWSLAAGLVTVRLARLELQVYVSQTEVGGRIQGVAEIDVPKQEPIQLLAAAAYPGTGAWEFDAALMGTLDLFRLVYGLLRTDPPQWVNAIQIELADLAFHVSTGPNAPFSARGTLRVAISENLLGFDMKLRMTAEIERWVRTSLADEALAVALRDTRMVDAQTVTTGRLSGSFAINRITVTAAVSVQDVGKTYTFVVAYENLSLSATTSWDSTGGTPHQILTLRLSGMTLGGMVEYLVGLANPNADFRLDPPWDFLNTIQLSAFALVIDPTVQAVSLTYDLTLSVGFAELTSVGLRYERASGTPAVKFVLKATTLGDTEPKQFTWDALTQSPPSVPGKGQSLFFLRYLSLGQHVTPNGLTDYSSIPDVVDALVKAMRPIEDPRKTPIDPATMAFDQASQWLFAIDATVMDTVSVKMVLHDPDLYGVVIALSGAQAKSLAGLKVELTYTKVSDDIGAFHARLQIPDAFRQLQFGAVAVTLGIVTLDIYTNGNFRIDLGFPRNGDWTVSFAMEAGIFNGRGGLYFGVLNGATSTGVPAITNGTFSPVIELGVGLSVGVGRNFEYGPLRAGLSVNLVVVFEGVLAWFHPSDGDQPVELYFKCRGSAAIVGKIYGSVDFKVISASISVQITAAATLELAAYEATLVELSLSLKASASVTVVFWKMSFSFSLELRQSFVIGSDSTPPWRLAPGESARVRRSALNVTSGPARSGAALQIGHDDYRLVFDKSAKVFPDGRTRTARLTLVAAYTVADVPVSRAGDPAGSTGGGVAANSNPAYRLVVMLTTDNSVSPTAVTIADTRTPDVSRNLHASDAADSSFNQLVEGMLRWSLNALGVKSPSAAVELTQLDELVEQLAMVEAANAGFTWDNIQGFLANNLTLVVTGTPDPRAGADRVSGTPFPMLPVLEWSATGLPDPADRTRRFWSYQPIDATYEAEALAYFDKLDPRPRHHRPSPEARLEGDDGSAESMATFVLRDYFRLVARAAVQAAADLLRAFPHRVRATESLESIARGFLTTTVEYTVVPNDSVDHAAVRLGLSAAELGALNPGIAQELAGARPGDVLSVVIGVTPQAIAVANPDWPVTPGATAHLGTIEAQVGDRDTIAALARRYGVDADGWLEDLRTTTPLLRAGAAVPLPGYVYPNANSQPLEEAAAIFFVRLGMTAPQDVPLFDWYAEAIAYLNEDHADGALPAELTVPVGYEQTQTRLWPTLAGDTVADVAAYVALAQNVVAGSSFAAWLAAVRAANQPPSSGGIALPAAATATILLADTLALLQRRLLLDGDPAAFARYVVGAHILVPLVRVTVPGAVTTAPAGLTLLSLAQLFGLSLEDLAGRMAADSGVLAVRDDPLIVPDVPAMTLDDLCSGIHHGPAAATVNGQVGRFMLAGARLPRPVFENGVYRAIGDMTALYELLGQQVHGPSPPPPAPGADPQPAAVVFTVGKGEAADWLTFAESAVLGPDAGAEAGLVSFGDAVDQAVLSITGAELHDNYPATDLKPGFLSPPAPMPVFHELGARYPVSQVIPWQTTDGPMLPVAAPASVGPSLWLLPDDLVATAAGGESKSRFLLEQTLPQAGPGATASELSSWAWATLIRFGVRRIPGVPHTVEVLGANTVDRERLALALEYLSAVADLPARAVFPAHAGERARLRLLWQLPPTPGMAPGLSSIALVPEATFLVQTNLSTETRRGAGAEAEPNAAGDPTAGTHFASIGDADRFLTLLWECSVVGGGGYWLHYRGAAGDVPDSIFDQDREAELSLLVQLDSQSTTDTAKGWPMRRLLAFNNAAAVGDGVDPRSMALSTRAVDPPELHAQATMDPGQVGFTAELLNPGADPRTPSGRLDQLYSLLGYRLEPTAGFRPSDEGRPVSPYVPHRHDEQGLPCSREEDETAWHLSRVVDISRFAREHLPRLPGAPDPEADPYAGVSGSAARASLWFQDVFGNASKGDTSVSIPVRYTDPVIGVSAWPSTTLAYTVEPLGAQARVAVTVDLQAVSYQPAPGEAGDSAAARAGRDISRLAAVYYQLSQKDMSASILTSLEQAPSTEPTPLPVDVDVLRRYIIGGHALLGTIAAVGAAAADPAVTPSLDSVARWHGVGFDSLAAANADRVLDEMLEVSALQVPVSAAFRAGDTVAGLCAPLTPPPDPVAVLEDEDNVVLPLMPGTELATPPRDREVPTRSGSASSPSAADLAAEFKVSLGRLVAANEDRAGLLTPGFVFDCYGVKVAIEPDGPASDATLGGVASAFRAAGIKLDAAQVVAQNGDAPGLFRTGASLVLDGYVAQPGDTLDHNTAGLVAAELAPLNTQTIDLFPPGTPLFLTTVARPVPAGCSLARFAAAQSVAPGSLLRHNGGAGVASAAPPLVPGTWAWPDDTSSLRVPYTVRAGDSLGGAASRFLVADPATWAVLGLARVNAGMPEVVASGVTVRVGTQSVTTRRAASLEEVCRLFDPPVTLDALVLAIQCADVLAAGALLICPLAVLPGASPGLDGVTPDDAGQPFGVGRGSLLNANAGTPGIMLAGKVLSAWSSAADAPAPTETIAPADTLTAVVERFRARGVSTGIDAIAAANAGVGFLRPGGRVLLPPASAQVGAAIGGVHEGGVRWAFPRPVFRVHVSLELSRDPSWVDPRLAETATLDRTAVPAARSADGQQDEVMSLAGFAARVQAAIPVLRLATGRMLTEQGADRATDVWAVVFDRGAVARVVVDPPLTVAGVGGPQPRTFALRPLANSLIARADVVTKGFDVATGKLTPGQTRNYEGVDLEVWAAGLLADVELVLSAAYARGAYALNRPALDGIVKAKKILAGAVAHGLDYVLAPKRRPGPDPKRAAAIEALRQQLLVSLSRSYEASAVIQYDTHVTSSWSTTWARLSGSPQVALELTDERLKTASVSGGKVSLATGSSQVNFVLSVPDGPVPEALGMRLDFRVVELEFDIEREIEGYEKSDWLSFITPLGTGSPSVLHIDLGRPVVPVPLRAYPPSPIVVGQQALAPTQVTRLDDALHWRYRFSLQHQSAAQDLIGFEVAFNQPVGNLATESEDEDDLFAALAQYAAVSTPLLGLLAGLVGWEKATADQQAVLAAALGTYRRLAHAAAAAWHAHWQPAPEQDRTDASAGSNGGGPVRDVYDFAVRLVTDPSGSWYQAVKLHRTAVSGPGGVGWPEIVCITSDGTRQPLTLASTGPSQATYSFPLGPTQPAGTVPAFSLLAFEFTFPFVQVGTYQNATARAWVTRNSKLLGDDGPDTAPDFVYRTPAVSCAEPVFPFINVTDTIPIGTWSKRPLRRVLQMICDDDPAGRTFAIGARYAYTLVPTDPPVEVLLPVVQSTVGVLASSTITTLTDRMAQWRVANDPASEGGTWALSVDLYSSLDPAPQRPILQLKRLSSPLA